MCVEKMECARCKPASPVPPTMSPRPACAPGPVADTLNWFQDQQGLGDTPLYAVGVSAGGAFVMKLPRLITVRSLDRRRWVVAVEVKGWPPE